MNITLFSKNYFEIFELPVNFTLDLNVLSENYRALQSVVHPDRFANSGSSERLASIRQTSLINEAFQVLKKPVERAKYMMTLVNAPCDDRQNPGMSEAFLIEQMELREAIMEARDQTEPVQVLDDLSAKIRYRMSDEMSAFDAAYTAGQYENAKDVVDKMQFLAKVKIEIDDLLLELEDELAN